MAELTLGKTMVGAWAQITFTLLRLLRPTHPLDKYTLSTSSPPLKPLELTARLRVVEPTLDTI